MRSSGSTPEPAALGSSATCRGHWDMPRRRHSEAASFSRAGTGPNTLTAAMWWFDPATVSCRRAGRMPYPLADAGVFRTGRTAYLIGGETPNLSDGVIRITTR